MGNITNRVFDSSGPEGKVRGTPQQIIDKYTQLARDAQLANDRVAAENFQQHAEHYTRMLGDAQREMEARREQQQNQQGGGQHNQNAGQNAGQSAGQNAGQNGGNQHGQGGGQPQNAGQGAPSESAGTGPQPDVREQPVAEPVQGGDDAGAQSDAPATEGGGQSAGAESDAQQKPRRRGRAKAPKAREEGASEEGAVTAVPEDDASTLVETPEDAPKPRRPRTRAKAKPQEPVAEPGAGSDPTEAAE